MRQDKSFHNLSNNVQMMQRNVPTNLGQTKVQSEKKQSFQAATIKIHPGFLSFLFLLGYFLVGSTVNDALTCYANNFLKLERPSQLAQMKIKQLSMHNAHISNLKPMSIQILVKRALTKQPTWHQAQQSSNFENAHTAFGIQLCLDIWMVYSKSSSFSSLSHSKV